MLFVGVSILQLVRTNRPGYYGEITKGAITTERQAGRQTSLHCREITKVVIVANTKNLAQNQTSIIGLVKEEIQMHRFYT